VCNRGIDVGVPSIGVWGVRGGFEGKKPLGVKSNGGWGKRGGVIMGSLLGCKRPHAGC